MRSVIPTLAWRKNISSGRRKLHSPLSPATSGWVFTLPGGVRLGPLWGRTVAFETENNATLWPWLQIKEQLGLIARQERLSLNINTRKVWPSPTPLPLSPVVAVV